LQPREQQPGRARVACRVCARDTALARGHGECGWPPSIPSLEKRKLTWHACAQIEMSQEQRLLKSAMRVANGKKKKMRQVVWESERVCGGEERETHTLTSHTDTHSPLSHIYTHTHSPHTHTHSPHTQTYTHTHTSLTHTHNSNSWISRGRGGPWRKGFAS
jgi:hypothetical protein